MIGEDDGDEESTDHQKSGTVSTNHCTKTDEEEKIVLAHAILVSNRRQKRSHDDGC